MARFAVAAAVVLALLVQSADASAEERKFVASETALHIGLLSSLTHPLKSDSYLGLGGRVAIINDLDGRWVGGYLDTQAVGWARSLDDSRNWHPRAGAGFSGGYRWIGLETGLSWEGQYNFGEQHFAPAVYAIATPVFRLPFATVGFRVAIPTSVGRGAGLDLGGTFALAIPIRLSRRAVPKP